MIPEFPEFKKLELSDKKDVEIFTHKFPPYSDYNFFSMWGWNVEHDIKISVLNNNLVVVFNDYISGENFLSFIGNKKVIHTTQELLEFSQKKLHKNYLRLVPEEVYLHYKGTNFQTKHDRDAYDYIYLVEHLANMKGWTKNTSGKRIRKFLKEGKEYEVKHNLVKELPHDEYKELFRRWAQSKNISDAYELNEYKAFKRFLEIPDDNLRMVSLYMGNKMIGFTLYEILSNKYATSHFAKGDKIHYDAIYDLLNWEEAKYLHSQGVKYFNWEQDLGMSGLRYSKIKYRPAFFFKKIVVEPKQG